LESGLSLKEHLRSLEEQLLDPMIRTSPAELAKLFTDDFFEFTSSGNVIVKQDCLGEGGIGVFEMAIKDNFKIHNLSPDTTLTTYSLVDDTRMEHTLHSSIWKYRDGEWRLFFHQGTLIKG
jgi:hypothetical protein